MADQDVIHEAGLELNSRELRLRWQYYRGEQPRIWVTPKLRQMFRTLADSMNENYCGLAIHTRQTRMEITGFQGPGAEAAQALWDANHWDRRQADLFRWGLVYGRVYLMAADEGEDEDASDLVLAPNRPTLTWHWPSMDDPSRVELAVKSWYGRGLWHANIYDDTEIRRYVADPVDSKRGRRPAKQDWREDPDDPGGPHGFDGVPVFPIQPYGSEAPVLIDTISPLQDRINKLGANKFIAAEFGAFRQRVFFTTQKVTEEQLRQEPDTALVLDPGEPGNQARVEETTATELRNYDDAKAAEVDALFSLALMPRHLRIQGTGEPPSGRAIKADEGPLVEAIYDHHREFGAGLTAALDMLGIDADPVWRKPEVDDAFDEAEVVKAYVDSGVPWEEAVKRYAGWTQEDVDAVKEAAPAQLPASPGAALLQAFNGAAIVNQPPPNGQPQEA